MDVVVVIPVDRMSPGVQLMRGIRELRHRNVIRMIRLVRRRQALVLNPDDVSVVRRHDLREVVDEARTREHRTVEQREERRDTTIPQLHQRLVTRARITKPIRATLRKPHELQTHPVVAHERQIKRRRTSGRHPVVGLASHRRVRRLDAIFPGPGVAKRVARIARRDEDAPDATTRRDVLSNVRIQEEEIIVIVRNHIQHRRRATSRMAHPRNPEEQTTQRRHQHRDAHEQTSKPKAGSITKNPIAKLPTNTLHRCSVLI